MLEYGGEGTVEDAREEEHVCYYHHTSHELTLGLGFWVFICFSQCQSLILGPYMY